MEPKVEFAEVVEERSGPAAAIYIFAPTVPLSSGTIYTATATWGEVDAETGQERLATRTWTFTTVPIGSRDAVHLPAADPGRSHPEPPDPLWLIKNAAPDSTPCLDPFTGCSSEFEDFISLDEFQEIGRQRAALFSSRDEADPRDSETPQFDRWGTTINRLADDPPVIAAYAVHRVAPDLRTGESTSVFAPALLPPNKALLEVVTVYTSGEVNVRPILAVYQHGDLPSFTSTAKLIDDTFMAIYTSGGFYSTVIASDGDHVWRVYLWNYADLLWEEIAREIGVGSNENGWDEFEIMTQGRCGGDLPEFESGAIQVYNGAGIPLRLSAAKKSAS